MITGKTAHSLKKRCAIFLLFLTIIFILYSGVTPDQAELLNSTPEELSQLERVHVDFLYDGDTFRTAAGEDVRLIGIDTPEMNWGEGEAEFFAEEALAYSKQALQGKYVYLEYDQEYRDKYQRVLAYLFLEDGTFFNQSLLKQGYAGLLLIPPNLKYSDGFKEAAAEARVSSRGIWSQWEKPEESLPVISWQQVGEYLDQEVIVRGKIVDTYDHGSVIFLNYTDYTEEENGAFYLVIFDDALIRFDYNPARFLPGKEVMVRGKVEEYRGRPQIVINDPLQILINASVTRGRFGCHIHITT